MKLLALGLAAAAGYYGWTVHDGGSSVGDGRPAQEDRWTWRGRVAGGKTLEVRGVNGSIAAEAAAGAEAEVVAEKRGRRSDPDEVRIEVVEHEEGVTICAVYPGRRNRCEPGGGEMNTRNNDVEVDFTVRVPRGVAFVGANVNGGVEAVDLDGPVTLNTVNGSARLETSAGDARAHTVNGGITAVVRGAGGQRGLEFETVNGAISVTLPRDINADVEARTVNGSITPDIPITVSGRLRRNELVGRIGQGGRALRLRTVNGSIRIRATS
jgi:hypothetical protein